MPESSSVGFGAWLLANSHDIRNLVLAAAALIALPVFIWRVTLVRQWSEAAQRHAEALEREQRIAERNEAIDQLGHPESTVRTAAIFTLERVARELTSEHGAIVETLAAFVRDRVPVPLGPPVGVGRYGPPTPKQILVPPRADVQAAMTVIGRRDRGRDPVTLRLSLAGVNLSGYDLSGGEFTGADFRGSYFVRSTLANTRLATANLMSAHFEGADLYGANGQRANFGGAACPGARFATADLEGADFQHADLSQADFTRAKVMRADLRAAVLEGTRFDEAIGLPSARFSVPEPKPAAEPPPEAAPPSSSITIPSIPSRDTSIPSIPPMRPPPRSQMQQLDWTQ